MNNFRDEMLQYMPGALGGNGGPERIKLENPTPLETFGAAFRTENVIGSALSRRATGVEEILDGPEYEDWLAGNFDGYSLAMQTAYSQDEDAAEYLALSRGQTDFDNRLRWLDKLSYDREVLANAPLGTGLLAGITAGTLDPVQLPLYAIPALKSATLAKKLVNTGGGGFVGAGVAELGLQPMQPLRTREEGWANVGLSTAFGIGLGAGAHGLSKAMYQSLDLKGVELTDAQMGDLQNYLEAPDVLVAKPPEGGIDAGAAVVVDPLLVSPEKVTELRKSMEKDLLAAKTPEEKDKIRAEYKQELADHSREWSAVAQERIVRLLGRASPTVRVATSPFATARLGIDRLAENTLMKNRDMEGGTAGVGPSVETKISLNKDRAMVNMYEYLVEEWSKFNKIDPDAKFKSLRVKANMRKGGEAMNIEDFSTEVGRAIVAGGKHMNPQVQSAAVRIKKIFDQFEGELLDLELIGTPVRYLKDPETKRYYDKATGEEIQAVMGEDGILRFPIVRKLPKGEASRWNLYYGDKLIGDFKTVPAAKREISRAMKMRDETVMVNGEITMPLDWRFDDKKKSRLIGETEGEGQNWMIRKTRKLNRELGRKEITIKTMTRKQAKTKVKHVKPKKEAPYYETVPRWDSDPKRRVKEDETELVQEMRVPAGDKWYLPRIWNFDRIRDRRGEFNNTVLNAIHKQRKQEIYKATGGKLDIENGEQRSLLRELEEEMEELKLAIPDYANGILNTPTGFVPKDLVFPGSHLEERTWKIATEEIQDFLIQDIRYVMHGYLDSMVPRIELQKEFGGFDMQEWFDELNAEYQTLHEKLPDGKSKTKLAKQYEQVQQDILGIRDILLRNFKRPDNPNSWYHKAGRYLRQMNYVNRLGGMTLSAVPDIANIVLRQGMRTFSRQLIAMLKNGELRKMSRHQNKQFAVLSDYYLNARAHAMLYMDESYGHSSKIDNAINQGVRNFGNMAGMTYWNSWWKGIAAGAFTDDVGRYLVKGIGGEKFTRKLRSHGLGDDMLERIKVQYQKHAEMHDGIYIANTEAWDDLLARESLEAATLSETNHTIVTPGIGDIPLVAHHPLGKVWLQFLTFPMAANNRILMGLVQDMNMQKAAGMSAMITLGAMTYVAKEFAAGREPDYSINTLAREALDRSGLLGYWGPINAITEKATANAVGLSAVLPGEISTKYRARSVINDLFGPSMGTVKDLVTMVRMGSKAITDEEISPADISAARRLIPLQNIFYLQRFFDMLEDSIKEQVEQ